jgi:hypothetical protein
MHTKIVSHHSATAENTPKSIYFCGSSRADWDECSRIVRIVGAALAQETAQ